MEAYLCREIKNASRQIWNQIEKGKVYGINQQEETITETVLLYLAEKLGEDIMRIYTIDKGREGILGADWEWHIHQKGKWLKLRVQAKSLKGNSYESLYQSAATKGTTFNLQLEQFIHQSLTDGFIPVYTFYNHIQKQKDIDDYVKLKNLSGEKKHFPVDEELIGWTYATAVDVLYHHSLYKGKKGVSLFSNTNFMKMNHLVANPFCNCENNSGIVKTFNGFVKSIKDKDTLLQREGITTTYTLDTTYSKNLTKLQQNPNNARNVVILDLDALNTYTSKEDSTSSEKQGFEVLEILKKLFNGIKNTRKFINRINNNLSKYKKPN
ncbi:hypothetical protein HPY21_15510 [Bacillus stratosphericus]|nr:hypothetical protein [Bacillus stratosphericus]